MAAGSNSICPLVGAVAPGGSMSVLFEPSKGDVGVICCGGCAVELELADPEAIDVELLDVEPVDVEFVDPELVPALLPPPLRPLTSAAVMMICLISATVTWMLLVAPEFLTDT